MTQVLSHPQKRGNSMPFRSILFDQSEIGADIDGHEAPEFFTDLNLDQIVAPITAGRDEYNLKPFFYTPLRDVETICYRYEILRDLENQALFGYIQSFAQEMRTMRAHVAQAVKLYYNYHKHSWFLDAVDIYCLRLEGKRIKVGPYDSDPDYGADVLQTFEKFKQGATKQYRFKFSSWPDMNHVEAAVLDMVARLYPNIFSSLNEYCSNHRSYLDHTIAAFDREVQFYVACLEHIDCLKPSGLLFCYPAVTDQSKEVYGREVFDLALATKLIRENAPVVTNDFYLRGPERILVVSGPNQGGKTTFARTFGQLHYLASIGCPVPGREAGLFLFDRLFTHFEREEDIQNLSGKLEDDLLRIHRILQQATPNSILIMNESFVSTTLSDALFLSRQVMQQIIQRDMLCVSVTFLDELASLGETTVSMVSNVNPEDPALRTFKIVRRPADGLAYAAAIAEKYRLTYESVKGRIGA
jgi:hypothetical protein